MLSAWLNPTAWPRCACVRAGRTSVVAAALLITAAAASAQDPSTVTPPPVPGPPSIVDDAAPLAPDPALYHTLFSQLDDQDPKPAPPPLPASTGIKSVFRETWRDFKAFPRRRSTWAILAISGGAALASHPLDDDANAKLGGSDAAGKFFAAGKYLGAVYTQAGVAVGLYAIGRYVMPHAEGAPKTNKVSHLGFDMLRALAVSQSLTQVIKFSVQRDRPTGECCAFPSGHASASFATAAVLERHLGYRALPTYLVASYVAMSRLHDNRHFVSDVIFGAGLGIASGWTVVGRHGRSSFALTPVPIRGGMMLAFTRDTSDTPRSD